MKPIEYEKLSTKWFDIKKKGSEREIEIAVVVEFYRFLFYSWFFFIIVIGTALTYGVTAKENENFYKVIEGVFGSVNICAYFDFPPSTYFLPALYSIQIILIYKYSSMGCQIREENFKMWFHLIPMFFYLFLCFKYCLFNHIRRPTKSR